MIWSQVFISGSKSRPHVRAAVAHSLGLPVERVVAISSFESDAEVDADALVECREIEGDFQLQCLVVVKAGAEEGDLPTPVSGAVAMARFLSTLVLVSDDSPNPYTWLLADPSGVVSQVAVDLDTFDDGGELRIDHAWQPPDR